jgi:hypothetical protein
MSSTPCLEDAMPEMYSRVRWPDGRIQRRVPAAAVAEDVITLAPGDTR